MVRGCGNQLPEPEYDACNMGDGTCRLCQDDQCNSRTTFLECRVCDSNVDGPNCIRYAYAMASKPCRVYNDECYVHVDQDQVIRGCLSDQTIDTDIIKFREKCAPNSEWCEICAEDNCNRRRVDGEFCLACDSSDDPNCRLNANYTMRSQCPLSLNPAGCFRFEDYGGRLVKRGCLTSVTEPERQMCRRDGSTCKTCLGNDCNAKMSFQRCRVCSSADSVNCIRSPGGVITKTCKNYLDECFVHVAGDVVTRGCLGEQSKPKPDAIDFRRDCKNEHICETCSDRDNCNNKLVNGEFCYVCDAQGDDGPRCRSRLDTRMRKQCPLSVTPLGCFRFEDNHGDQVKRGCLSNLTLNEANMCRENNEKCKTCLGNDCNSKLLFQHCHVCNSTKSLNCIRGSQTTPTTTCKSYTDECFTHVADDVVTRGCLLQQNETSAIDLVERCQNTDECDKCSDESNCNKKIVDGEFCITCSSDTDPNCRANVSISMRTQCSLAVKQLGCYRLEDDGGAVVKRGCLSDVTAYEREMCRRNGDNCKTCTGNDCNAKPSFAKCRSCSSKDGVTCIRNAAAVPAKVCKDYMDECFTHVAGDVVTRGCLREMTTTINNYTNDCQNPDVCAKCSDQDFCNVKLVDGEFCLTCDTETDANCRSNVSISMRTQCPLTVNKLGCYRFEDDGGALVKRGCVGNVTAYEREMCRRNGDSCKTCLGNDCNAKIDFQQCRACNSKETVGCVRNPNGATMKTCKHYLDECFTHVENDVVTRGCLHEDTAADCINSDLCEKCAVGGGCNNKLIDGEFCMECDSDTDANCRRNTTLGMRVQCPLAVKRVGCFRFEDNNGDVVKRGCLSRVSQFERDMCRREGRSCKFCLGNDCNEKPSFAKCRVCSSKDNVNCIRAANAFPSQTCTSYNDECFTYVAGDVVTRGCLKDSTQLGTVNYTSECKNDDICSVCSDGDSCNNKIVNGEFCITCNSDTDPNCRSNLSFSQRTQCPLAVKPVGCYRFEDENGALVKRGCLSNVTADEVSMCRQNGDYCKTCFGNDCNAKVRFERCLDCDSRVDINCLLPELASIKTCRNYADKCFTHFDNNHVVRGCLSDAPTAIATKCQSNSLSCNLCNSNNTEICNGNTMGGDERCIVCDSRTDPLCEQHLNVTMSQMCGSAKDNAAGCFLRVANGTISRGCASTLNEVELNDCNAGGDCKLCYGQNCNRKIEFQSCLQCNSTHANDCVYGGETVPTAICREYLDFCMVRVDKQGVTHRGCLKQISDNSDETLATTCANNNCNDGIFPNDRHRCYQCNDSRTCAIKELQVCQTYSKNDRCYTYIDQGQGKYIHVLLMSILQDGSI